MGLDMYLEKKTYVKNWDHMSGDEKTKISVEQNGKPHKGINPKKISYITEEIGYWRKANAIHKFFVDCSESGDDNCEPIYISDDQLKDLLDRCDKILADHELAHELLPTQAGFFFGGTSYDEDYFQDLRDTKEIVQEALKAIEAGSDIYYQASW